METPFPLAAVPAHGFAVAALAFGGLLVFGALLSGLARRSFLSLTALFVVAGFALGHGGFEVVLAALAVFTSIIAHGLSDTPGAEWIGRRARSEAAGGPSGKRTVDSA